VDIVRSPEPTFQLLAKAAYVDARASDARREAANHWVLVDNAEDLRAQDKDEQRESE
jgi:hypothetical protein